jgi:hypothetical protein
VINQVSAGVLVLTLKYASIAYKKRNALHKGAKKTKAQRKQSARSSRFSPW